jgi:hypothetical protein
MNALFIILVLLLGTVLYYSLFGSTEGFQATNQTTNQATNQTTNQITKDINNLAKEVNLLQSQTNSASVTGTPVTTTQVKTTPGYDNYNHYNKTSIPTLYYGPNGSTANLISSNGIYTITVTDKSGMVTTYSIDSTTYKMYYGPDGSSATIVLDNGGNKSIKVTDVNGKIIIYSSDNKPNLKVETKGAVDIIHSSSTTPTNYNSAYTNPPPSANPYANYLPKGIPRHMIPPGNEDLYILKSEVVPPVCPVCPPPVITCPKNDVNKCPPCPPCARCPEPSFECKKVPNYSSSGSNQYLPQPIVNDFSTFGM